MVVKFYRRLKNLNVGEPSGYASNTGRWMKCCALTLRSVCGYPGSSFFSWQGTPRDPAAAYGAGWRKGPQGAG